MNTHLDKWLSPLSTVVTLIFGVIFGALLAYWGFQLDKHSTTKDYLHLLSNKSNPAYLKGLVFSSMLRYELAEADLLLTAAYQAESEEGQEILKDLFYEYARHEPIDMPIGYIDLIASRVDSQSVYITGWVLDKAGIDSIVVRVDDVTLPGTAITRGGERKDVDAIFGNYNEVNAEGITIRIPIELFRDQKHILSVRLNNEEMKFMDILDTEVSLMGSRLVQNITR